MHRLELVYGINYFNLFKKAIQNGNKSIKRVPGLNRSLSSNFWLMRSANHVKLTEGCVMWTEKDVLIQKYLQMGWTLVCHYEPEFKRQLKKSKKYWIYVKEKYQTQRPGKKFMLTVIWHIKRPITIDFFKKRCNWIVLPITNSLDNISPYSLNIPCCSK